MIHKKTIIFLLFLFCLQFFVGVDVIFAEVGKPIKFTPAVEIPGIEIVNVDGKGVALRKYISGFYKFAIGLTGILATVMIAIGGITWLTAGGASGQIGKAKQMIGGSLVGLVLALFSYTILYTINPDIVALKFPKAGVGLVREVTRGCSWQGAECDKTQTEMTGKDNEKCGKEPEEGDNRCCCDLDGCCHYTDWSSADKYDECFWGSKIDCEALVSENPSIRIDFHAEILCNDASIGCEIKHDCTFENEGKPCKTDKFCIDGHCTKCIADNKPCVIDKKDKNYVPCCSGTCFSLGIVSVCEMSK